MKIDDILAEAPTLDPATRQARMQRAAKAQQQPQTQPAEPAQPEPVEQPAAAPAQQPSRAQQAGNAIRNVGGKIAQGIDAVTQAWQQGTRQPGTADTANQQAQPVPSDTGPIAAQAQQEQPPAQQPQQQPQSTQQQQSQQPVSQGSKVSMSNVFSNPTELVSSWQAYTNANGKFTPALKSVIKNIWMSMGGVKAESKE